MVAAAGHRQVGAPIFVLPGQAPDCVTLPLGWGRAAGGLGAGVGFNAYMAAQRRQSLGGRRRRR